MKIAVMQPYFFPYAGYFQLINSVDKFILLDDVNFINKGWINRNYILQNGKHYMFTVPVKNKSQNKKINQLEFVKDGWQQDFLQTLKHSYSKSPNFSVIINLIESVLDFSNYNISSFIHNSLKIVLSYLNIEKDIIHSASIHSVGKGHDKIISICKYFNADVYINASGGAALYQKTHFDSAGITLKFITNDLSAFQDTERHLSLIHHLMKFEPKFISHSLNQFSLIEAA